jgi:malonate-semialdehyde dehydrogenase (acetylating)/methylmalonate-semialdehyde dehydrogenase
MRIYKEEIFGPVLSVVRAKTTRRRCGCRPSTNTATASRSSPATATPRATSPAVNVGMVGINVPIPVPIAYHTFGGWKRSGFGDLNQHGPDSIRFYTKTKTVTARAGRPAPRKAPSSSSRR